MIKNGKVRRGQLGVAVQRVTGDMAASLGMQEPHGVIINSVDPGGPADKAGLRRGDVILDMNGEDVTDPNTLRNRIAGAPPGSEATFTILRNGKQQQVKVRLGEFEPPQTAAAGQSSRDRENTGTNESGLGVTLVPLTPAIDSQLGLPANSEGLLVASVDPSGAAADAGIRHGDVIMEINRTPVRSVKDVRAALAHAGSRPVLVLINRDGQTAYVTLRPK